MASSDDRSTLTSSSIYPPHPRHDKAGKPSSRRTLQMLVGLYNQKDRWRTYGGLRTCCHDVVIVSPVKVWWWMAQLFVLATAVCFTYEFFFLNWMAVVPAVIVAFLELLAFYKTCLKDPGVLKRPDFVTAFRNLVKVLAAWVEGNGIRRYVVYPGGANEQLNYCWRCNHYRAVTTSHCGICDCCMLQHDHHCPVFGGCVAKENGSSFHTMIISMGCFWLYTMGFSIYNMATTTESFVRRVNSTEYNDDNYVVAARITFYMIIGEIFAVLCLPPIFGCIKFTNSNERGAYKNEPVPPEKIPQLVEEMLQFARENNIPPEEELQLREILQVEEDTQVERQRPITIETNDLNHNHYVVTAV